MLDSLLNALGRRFLGRAFSKLLTTAAVWLVASGVMKPEAQDSWVSNNAEVLAGLVVWLLSWMYSHWHHKQAVAAAKERALDEVEQRNPQPWSLVLCCLLAGSVCAHAEPQPLGEAVLQGVKAAARYAQEHGEVGAGYFFIVKDGAIIGRGVGTAQSIYPLEFTPLDAWQVKLGIAHASVPCPERSWELALATVSFKLLELSAADKLSTAPITGRALRLRWGGLRGGLFVGSPVDTLALAAGAQVQWEFGN